MPGKFQLKKFSEIDINDAFFNSLKEDYPADESNIGFEKWFAKKTAAGSTALVFNDEIGLGAFVCLKDENEPIELVEGILPAIPRKKLAPYSSQSVIEGSVWEKGLLVWRCGIGRNPKIKTFM